MAVVIDPTLQSIEPSSLRCVATASLGEEIDYAAHRNLRPRDAHCAAANPSSSKAVAPQHRRDQFSERARASSSMLVAIESSGTGNVYWPRAHCDSAFADVVCDLRGEPRLSRSDAA